MQAYIHGDCLDKLRQLADNSVDSICTDPPYGLDFMGKAFDTFTGNGIDPGFCHWLAGFTDGEGCFSVHKKNVNGCETYDCQFSIQLRRDDKPVLERIQRELGIGTIHDRPGPGGNAGPQVRYCVSSQRDCKVLRDIFRAFPLRAKKATDFQLWSETLDRWLEHERGAWGDMADARDRLMANRKYKVEGVRVDPFQLWCMSWARECLRVLKPGGYLLAFGGTRTYHRLTSAIEDAGFEIHDSLTWIHGNGYPKAKTCLKPSHEPIAMARKPAKGRRLRPLNIDDNLIGGEGGRYPANVILSHSPDCGWYPGNCDEGCPVAELDRQSGQSTSRVQPRTARRPGSATNFAMSSSGRTHADSGGASRFFYCAKAPKAERPYIEGIQPHTTVKPLALMRHLVRLVTPAGGLVLDPFAGTGTTAEACELEGLDSVSIEREEDSIRLMAKRMEKYERPAGFSVMQQNLVERMDPVAA
jgi:DNA modification methylase